MDVALATIALVLTAPVLALAALAIRLDSPGPALFVQTRVGRNGRTFRLVKLRTMTAGNDDADHRAYVAALIEGGAGRHGGLYKLVDDPRITRVGRILRRFSVDELPQFWNVFRGDMSVVGPRPPLPEEVARYDARARRRLSVKPGVTGLWQVSGRCLLSFDEMVTLDLRYVDERSLWLDVAILLRTPLVVLTARGAA